jgi:hypothetical protein
MRHSPFFDGVTQSDVPVMAVRLLELSWVARDNLMRLHRAGRVAAAARLT